MDKESYVCTLCLMDYNTSDRIPRLLIDCGHNLCSSCLREILSNPKSRKCPFDHRFFSKEQKSLEYFPPNSALLALLEEKQKSICQVHGEEFTDICFQDKVKLCPNCIYTGEHNYHSIKKIKELKLKGTNLKKDLEKALTEFEWNQIEKDQYVETLKNKYLGQVGSKAGGISKILKNKHMAWKKQMENLFEINTDNQIKKEANKAIEEIDHAFQKEEYLTFLDDREFSSIMSRLQPHIAKEEVERLSQQTERMISSFEAFLVNQSSLIKSFDLFNIENIENIENGEQEEPKVEEGRPEQNQQEGGDEPQKVVSSENPTAEEIIELSRSILRIQRPFQIRVRNENPIEQTINLNNKINNKVEVYFEEYDSLFKEDLDSLPQIFHQLSDYTSLFIHFFPSGLTDDRALYLINLLFPRIQYLTEIEIWFQGCEITNQPITYLCTNILPQATSLKHLTLKLGSTLINDFSLSPFNQSLETFKLEAENTELIDDVIVKITQVIEGVKELNLCLQRTKITDGSLKMLGGSPCMRNLERFVLDVSGTEITMEGVDAIFTAIPENIRVLVLNFKGVNLPEEVVSLVEEKVRPKLEVVETVHLRLEGEELEAKVLEIVMLPIKRKQQENEGTTLLIIE